jgi:hypothetical protein
LGGKRIVRCPINPDHAFESVPSILQKDLYLLTPELKNGFGTEPIRGFGKKIQQEIDMSKIIRAALVAAALLTGATAAIADTVPDQSDQYGGYDHNSQEGTRAFWEQQTRHGN